MSTFEEINDSALLVRSQELASVLRQHQRKIVFAESCTAGLLASSLSRIPGISDYLCGSMVTYRNATKIEWLGVDGKDLNSPEIGPVSVTVAAQMAAGVLEKTPEADIAVSITGHLGPDAPDEFDGVAFVAVLFREAALPQVTKLSLIDSGTDEADCRRQRQIDAAIQVMQTVLHEIDVFL